MILLALAFFLLVIAVLGTVVYVYLRKEQDKIIPNNKAKLIKQQPELFTAPSKEKAETPLFNIYFGISGLVCMTAGWAILLLFIQTSNPTSSWYTSLLFKYIDQRNLWILFGIFMLIAILLTTHVAFLGMIVAIIVIYKKRQILITIGLLGTGLLSGYFTIINLIGERSDLILWFMTGLGLGVGFFSFAIMTFDSKKWTAYTTTGISL